MGRKAPPGNQRIIPYLGYRDCPAAIDFLCEAFGFEERFRMDMPGRKAGHAELGFDDNCLMLASAWEVAGQLSPLDLPGVHTVVFCWVDDVDAHYRRARAAGATVIAEPADRHGTRACRALDPEGHRWIFASPLGEDAP